ncbi:MAG: glycosyltransferase family 9 protein [Alphaproteobacteria bacterium]|nr:glycosyltransferase family 9 protein [Alphaproteobacteria bacterium]
MTQDHSDIEPATPLTKGYLARNPRLLALLRTIDALPWPRSRQPDKEGEKPPRRLLLANWAHLGDCVITTATLDLVRRVLPDTEIGLLVGQWSAPIFKNDPRIRWLHYVDHWFVSRTSLSKREKLRRYWFLRRRAVAEMRAVGYDAAIDLYHYFPPAAPLFRDAGIGRRIGYESGGFRRFLTHSRPWPLADRHIAEYQAALISDLGISPASLAEGLAVLKPSLAQAAGILAVGHAGAVVVHMGAGAEAKEWPEPQWRDLVVALCGLGLPVVLTGRGAAERARCQRVAEGLAGVLNLCDALDWDGLVAVVAAARLLVCVDSLAGHIAAACDVPVLTLWSGVNNPAHWRPLGRRAEILHTAPPCLPCYRTRNCTHMACIREIDVASVLAAAVRLAGVTPTGEYAHQE